MKLKLVEKSEDMLLLNKLLGFIKKWYLAILFFMFVAYIRKYLNISFDSEFLIPYEVSAYLLNYTDGFGSRMLVGSVYQFIFGGHISAGQIAGLNEMVLNMDVILVCCILCYLINKQKDEKRRTMVLLLSIVLFALPSLSFFVGKYLGRLEVHLVFWAISSILVLKNKSLKDARYVIVMAFSVIAILIHQVYIFTYFVPVFAAMVWLVAEEQFSKKTIAKLSGIVLLPMCAVFLYMQCFSGIHYDTLEEIHEVCQTRTNDLFDDHMFKYEYLDTFKENFGKMGFAMFKNSIGDILHSIFMLWPLWTVVIVFWHKVFLHTEDKKKKLAFGIMHASYLIYIPLFMMTIDYGRWMSALLISVMAGIYLAVCSEDEAVTETLDELYPIYKKYSYLVYLSIAYLSIMDLYGISV